MRIASIAWDDDAVAHISRHGVTPFEVEDVCFSRPFIQRARGGKKNPLYFARGQTAAGRYLTIVFRYLGSGKARIVTARDMNHAERRAYQGGRP